MEVYILMYARTSKAKEQVDGENEAATINDPA